MEPTDEIHDTLVELCSRILQCSEEDVRNDTKQYAVFNRDCFLEAIDFENVEFLDKQEMKSLFSDDGPRLACGRNDLDLPRSLVTDKCLDEIVERDLVSFAKKYNFTLKMYGELLSQGRIKRYDPKIYGRVESGSSLVECVVAAFGLHEDLPKIDKREYVIHADWNDFVASISNPILADHIGMFFQNGESIFGGSFEAQELEATETFDFEFHGFQIIGTWNMGDQDGSNRLYIVKITGDDAPPLPKFSERYKPENLPDDAVWGAEDPEWTSGPRDEDGKYHGEIHCWRPDGTFSCIDHYVHGVLEGGFQRFHENGEVSTKGTYVGGKLHGLRTWIHCHEPTTEQIHAPGVNKSIWRVEITYNMGQFDLMRFFLEDGREVDSRGTPVVRKPEAVPPNAVPNSTGWVSGVWDEKGTQIGKHNYYDFEGKISSTENYKNGKNDGIVENFRKDGTTWAKYDYEDGRFCGPFSIHHASGAIARKGETRGGKWLGVLEDFDENGQSTSTHAWGVLERKIVNSPSKKEISAMLGKGFEFSNPSSTLLAKAIAMGWAGDEERDPSNARKVRSVVKEFAKNNEALGQFLEESGLAYAPRLVTFSRILLLQNLAEKFDIFSKEELVFHLSECEGIGATSALINGGSSANRWLATRVADGKLNLAQLGLERVPDEIQNFPTVETLNLERNNISVLPISVCRLPRLVQLRLTSNSLTDLPDDLRYLQSLQSLYISKNNVSTLPESLLHLSNLRTLDLSSNQLRTLPDNMDRLVSLKTLWLNDNPLEDLGGLTKLKNLKFLHLGNIPWEKVPPEVWDMVSLESLWIASGSLSHLPEEVGQLKNLKGLKVWYSNLSTLPAALFKMTHLEELRIRNNPLPESEIEKLKLALPDCTIY